MLQMKHFITLVLAFKSSFAVEKLLLLVECRFCDGSPGFDFKFCFIFFTIPRFLVGEEVYEHREYYSDCGGVGGCNCSQLW